MFACVKLKDTFLNLYNWWFLEPQPQLLTQIGWNLAQYISCTLHSYTEESNVDNGMAYRHLSRIIKMHGHKTKYSRTSVAWTPMAHSPWMIRTRFWVPTKFFR